MKNPGHFSADIKARAWTAFSGGGGGSLLNIPDNTFGLADNADATKKLDFQLSGITTGVTRTLTAPDASGIIALLSGSQTFAGVLTLSHTSASLGTSIATATYDLGSGTRAAANTKTINLGSGGAAGSTTVVNIGSATASAGGTTVVNTPTVTFANAVTVAGCRRPI